MSGEGEWCPRCKHQVWAQCYPNEPSDFLPLECNNYITMVMKPSIEAAPRSSPSPCATDAAALAENEALNLRKLKDKIDYRLNDYLCEMKPDYDDSITGFNEAWDIVRKAFGDALASSIEATGGGTGQHLVADRLGAVSTTEKGAAQGAIATFSTAEELDAMRRYLKTLHEAGAVDEAKMSLRSYYPLRECLERWGIIRRG